MMAKPTQSAASAWIVRVGVQASLGRARGRSERAVMHR